MHTTDRFSSGAHVERHDVGTVRGEGESDGSTLPVCGTGDEGDRAVAHAGAPRYGSRQPSSGTPSASLTTLVATRDRPERGAVSTIAATSKSGVEARRAADPRPRAGRSRGGGRSRRSARRARRAEARRGPRPSSIEAAAGDHRADQAGVLDRDTRGRRASRGARPAAARPRQWHRGQPGPATAPSSAAGECSEQVHWMSAMRPTGGGVGQVRRSRSECGGNAPASSVRGDSRCDGLPSHDAGVGVDPGPARRRAAWPRRAARRGGRRGASRTARRAARRPRARRARGGRRRCGAARALRRSSRRRAPPRRSCAGRAPPARGRTPSRSCSSSRGCSWWADATAAPASSTRRASG